MQQNLFIIRGKRLISLMVLSLIFTFSTQFSFGQVKKTIKDKGFTQFVDPYIGTGAHGHVFVGANVPFGAVQLGPTNLSEGWDWCSGYHFSDSTIVGFAHTHLSGTGIGDLGDLLFMPAVGDVEITKGRAGDLQSGYYSLFSHQEEIAKPGYYSVRLKRYNIKAELTASERVGFQKYTFPQASDAKIIIDLKEGIGWDASGETHIKQLNDTTLVGYRYSKGWANDQRIFFTAIFSKRMKKFAIYDSAGVKSGLDLTGKKLKGVAFFSTSKGERILVKVGISPVSIANAALNIKAEIPLWDFNKAVKHADLAWNTELEKVKIKTDDLSRMKTFYTALYHTMIAPSIYNDHNGDYLGTDKKVYRNASFTNLTTFSLWDTYRAAHPLFTLLQPKRVNDMVSTMLAIYQQQGKLPVWHLMGNETNTMVGNPAITVVADAFLKGFKGFDQNLAYEAMKNTAMLDERGLNYVKKLGYIPGDSLNESVAIGMEYAVADWSLGQVAKKIGKQEDYVYFNKRGHNYKNYFDPQTKFMRAKLSATTWRTPFNPFESVHRRNDYTEGNGWQYLWLVPQDPEGLIGLLGGDQLFTNKLDSLFTIKGDMGKEASPDISGLIGQYAHGNEPSHHVAYLYTYAGRPEKTAEKVRFILDNMYTDKFDGLSGNEDVGQMSAWYVFSALGFYPVNPANSNFVFGSPVINEAELNLAGGKTMKVLVVNNSKTNKYIQRITLNGNPYTKSYISYADLTAGGNLKLEMGSKPSVTYGVKAADRPYSEK
jgi:predicted alpha-1,2-mannosidase